MLVKADLEIELIGKFDNPNIAKCMFCFDHGDHLNGKYYLLMWIGDLG